MRKLLPLLAFFVILGVSNVFAQTTSVGDTLIIGPEAPDGSLQGALNIAILGDTTDTGERIHKVYKLQRGAQYLLTATIAVSEDFVLVADDGDTRPPIVRSGQKEDGSAVAPLFNLGGNIFMRNIYITGVQITGQSTISWHNFVIGGNNVNSVFEKCVFENPWTGWTWFAAWGQHTDFFFTDCIIRNNSNGGQTWAGAFAWGTGLSDTAIFKNTTFYNFGCASLTGSHDAVGILYHEFDHCSFVNSTVHQFVNNKPVESKVTNNIFFNCHAYSDDTTEMAAHEDGLIHGIIHLLPWDEFILDSVWGDHYDPDGDGQLTNEERVYTVANNAWYYSQPIEDYWAAYDTVEANIWMNDSTKIRFFDVYPNFTEENTWNADPGFVNEGGAHELLADMCIAIREGTDGVMWGYNGDGADVNTGTTWITFPWPLPEDLSYTNADFVRGGTDGFAIGDLNWFPEQKAEWLTGVKDVEYTSAVPAEYNLSQNYPNPFNPTTNIEFSIPEADFVNLTVYNVLGQKVEELMNKEITAGTYNVTFDASSLTSGIYFYTLTGQNFVSTKKMMLIK